MDAFETYLRTGRRKVAGPVELKFNPWHDADDGRFTFAGGGGYFPGGSHAAPGSASRRPAAPPVPKRSPQPRTLSAPRQPRAMPAPTGGLNGHGYHPQPGDERTLTRMIFAESAGIPGDHAAIGWSIVNRIGRRQHGSTLDAVLHQRNAFAIVRKGGGGPNGSPLWRASAKPALFKGDMQVSWQSASRIAHGSCPEKSAIQQGAQPFSSRRTSLTEAWKKHRAVISRC